VQNLIKSSQNHLLVKKLVRSFVCFAGILSSASVWADAKPGREPLACGGIFGAWEGYETQYRNLRARQPQIKMASRETFAIDTYLGRGFTNFLMQVDQLVQALPEERIESMLADLQRQAVEFAPLPYTNGAFARFTKRFQEIVDLANGGSTSAGPAIFQSPESGRYFSESELADRYLHYALGMASSPTPLGRKHWELLRANYPERFDATLASYRQFEKNLPSFKQELSPLIETVREDASRDPRYFDYLQTMNDVVKANVNEGSFLNWTRRATFDWSGYPINYAAIDGFFFSVPMPVGDYGLALNRDLRRTSQILQLLVEQNFRDVGQAVTDAAPTLLRSETARGRTQESEGGEPTIVRATVEGFVSITQYLNLLLSSRLPSDDDPSRLIQELLLPQDGSPNARFVAYTARLRMSTVGSSTLSGYRFANPLRRDVNGTLQLSAAFSEELKRRVAERTRDVQVAQARGALDHRAGLSCPVASVHTCMSEKTGLQYANEAFWRIYQVVHRISAARN
jgi:hypothetical protein